MKRSKDFFIQLAEEFMFKNQLGFFDFDKPTEEQYEVEEFEVTKGDYKTIITFKFNKQGYPVSHMYESRLIPTEEDENENRINS